MIQREREKKKRERVIEGPLLKKSSGNLFLKKNSLLFPIFAADAPVKNKNAKI